MKVVCVLKKLLTEFPGVSVVGVVFLTLILGVGAVVSQPKSSEGSLMEKIRKRGYVIVGVRHDVPDMGYLDPLTKKLDGVDIRIAYAFAKAIFNDPAKIQFKQTTGRTRIPMLKEGDVDIVIANMTITEERAKEINFSKPYVVMGHKLAVLKTSPINSWEELAAENKRVGVTVCIHKGADYLVEPYKKAGFKITQLELFSEMVAALRGRRFDVMQGDEWNIGRIVADSPDLKGFREDPSIWPKNIMGAGFRKEDTELKDFFDDFLVKLTRSGELLKIVKTFVPAADPDSVPTY